MAKKTVRIFLDSNVILSGLLSDTGAPRLILDVLSMELPHLAAITGQYNIIEIERNIRKKAPKVLPLYREYFPKLRIELVPVPTPAEVTKYSGIIADKDTPVLVSAIKGKADFLVNRGQEALRYGEEGRHVPLYNYQSIRFSGTTRGSFKRRTRVMVSHRFHREGLIAECFRRC